MDLSVTKWKDVLSDQKESLQNKYDALFALRSIGTEEACQALRDSYSYMGTSDFLKHDVMYALGQIPMPSSIDFLIKTMNDENESAVVRHEAGEALSNFNVQTDRILEELQKYWNSPIEVLRSTVRISIRKIKSYNPEGNRFNKFMKGTIEPAEPFTEQDLAEYLAKNNKKTDDTFSILIDENVEEYTKYQIMYRLRDQGDFTSVHTIARLLKKEHRNLTSSLMRHEICFILGQYSKKADHKEVKEILGACIKDLEEVNIVRHEAILAYSEIWGNDELITLQKYDSDELVNQSAYIVLNEGHYD